MGIGAVHDGKFTRITPGADGIADVIDHQVGFFAIVFRHNQADLFSGLSLGEKLFSRTVTVLIDHAHGAVQDSLRGTVVLLEQDHLGVFEITFKTIEVAIISAAPTIDGLVFIADHI